MNLCRAKTKNTTSSRVLPSTTFSPITTNKSFTTSISATMVLSNVAIEASLPHQNAQTLQEKHQNLLACNARLTSMARQIEAMPEDQQSEADAATLDMEKLRAYFDRSAEQYKAHHDVCFDQRPWSIHLAGIDYCTADAAT